MPYEVKFNIPERPLGKADISFVVKNENGTLGTLLISVGSLVWFPSGTTYGHKMTWKQFADKAEGFPSKEKR